MGKRASLALFTKFAVPTTGYYAGLPPGQALVLWSLCGTNTTCQWQALEDRKAHMGWGKEEVARPSRPLRPPGAVAGV